MGKNELNLLILLEENLADEAEARQGYYKILRDYSGYLHPAVIELIEEIIAEEKKHSLILRDMIYVRDNIEAEE